jgi:hypothetical protein
MSSTELLQHRHHPFQTTNQLPSTELQHRHHPFQTPTSCLPPSCNTATILSRRPTRCLPPSCNTATILSRRPTRCLPPSCCNTATTSFPDDQPAVFHRAATSPPSFPETASQLSSTELRHRHHFFPRRPHSQSWLLFASRVGPTVTALLLQHSSIQPDAPVARHGSFESQKQASQTAAASTFVLHTYCLIFFVVSLFLFSTLLQIHTILSTTVMSTGARRVCCLFVARGLFLFLI